VNPTYSEATPNLAHHPHTQAERDLIALVLLSAVEESFRPESGKARRWLRGKFAQQLLILLDIPPQAALERLEAKWAKLDLSSLFRGETIH